MKIMIFCASLIVSTASFAQDTGGRGHWPPSGNISVQQSNMTTASDGSQVHELFVDPCVNNYCLANRAEIRLMLKNHCLEIVERKNAATADFDIIDVSLSEDATVRAFCTLEY